MNKINNFNSIEKFNFIQLAKENLKKIIEENEEYQNIQDYIDYLEDNCNYNLENAKLMDTLYKNLQEEDSKIRANYQVIVSKIKSEISRIEMSLDIPANMNKDEIRELLERKYMLEKLLK